MNSYKIVLAIGAFLSFFCIVSSDSLLAQSDITFEELRLQNDLAEHSPFLASVSSGVTTSYKMYDAEAGQSLGVGPFVRPEMEYRSQKTHEYLFDLKYRFTASGSQVIGKSPSPTSFTDNVSFSHQPSVMASIHFSPNWLMAVSSIYGISTSNGDQKKNSMSIFMNPSVQYRIDEESSLWLGYLYDRTENFDTTMAEMMETSESAVDSTAKAADAAPNTSKKTADKDPASKLSPSTALAAAAYGHSPVKTLNAAEIGTRFKLFDDLRLRTSILSGRNISNSPTGGSYYNAFRFNLGSHLAKLKYNTFYQFNADVHSYSAGKVSYSHRIRVLLAYPLWKNWALTVENFSSIAMGSTPPRLASQAERAKFQNDQTLGLAYAF